MEFLIVFLVFFAFLYLGAHFVGWIFGPGYHDVAPLGVWLLIIVIPGLIGLIGYLIYLVVN